MSEQSDILVVPKFFAKRLSEGAQVASVIGAKIFAQTIPPATKTFDPYPCILSSFQGGDDLLTANARRVMGKQLHLVELACRETSLTSEQEAALVEMDGLLHQCTNYVHEDIPGFMFHSWRVRPSIRDSVNTAIGTFKYRGGFYRVEVIRTR